MNFTYDVFDISNDEKFEKNKLIDIKNVTAAIFLLDQKMDALEFLQRIKVIALYFNSLSDIQIKAIKKVFKLSNAGYTKSEIAKECNIPESKVEKILE